MTHPEHQYLQMMKRILEHGDARLDRTGVGTKSVFGEILRFDLSNGEIPIFTTKRVFWKTAVKEMLWFLTGGTNIRDLLKKNVRIWRSDELRVGKECVSKCSYRWSPDH